MASAELKKLRRLSGWELRLSSLLLDRRGKPFAWGQNDCLLFAADVVAAITGVDFADGQRGYGEAQAKEMLEAKSLVARIDEALGQHHKNYLKARRGDIVVIKQEEGFAAGVVDDSGERIAAVTRKGLVRLKLSGAWRIWSY